MMVVRPFMPLSTYRIIVWTVNEGSTPTIGLITLVKGDVAKRVVVLTVRIMCVALDPLTLAPYVIASFTEPIVCAIMWSADNVNRSKRVSNAKPNTRWCLIDVISAGTPNVPSVKNGCPSRTTSVIFNLW